MHALDLDSEAVFLIGGIALRPFAELFMLLFGG